MIKYISIGAVLLLLIIISTSVSITDKILIKSGSKVSQDEITLMRNAYIFDKNTTSTGH